MKLSCKYGVFYIEATETAASANSIETLTAVKEIFTEYINTVCKQKKQALVLYYIHDLPVNAISAKSGLNANIIYKTIESFQRRAAITA